MTSTPRWQKLYAEGRCKAPGVPFTDEETKAIHEKDIPVEYVRQGITTREEYEKALEGEKQDDGQGVKPVRNMDREELALMADDYGIEYSEETGRNDLLSMVTSKMKRMEETDQKAAEQESEDEESKEDESAEDEDEDN